MSIFLRAGRTCAMVLLACAVTRAEPAAELVPPVLEGTSDVPYPPGAEGDAAVVLELTVEKDGSVSRATVLDGVEPFAELARNAALSWRFRPARRNDAVVGARVRARVEFRQERQAESSASPPDGPDGTTPAAASVAAPKAAPPAEPVEITVLGERREIGQVTLSKTDVREMPGAFGDAFRAIEVLPGVTPIVSGVPYFYARGAPPNNAGYLLDGVRVPLLFHIGLGQGVIHPGLIERVDFFPSAAPARYGRFAGGVVAGETRAPSGTFRGEANLRLVDAGALLEAPLEGGRGSVLVAGRYGYPGAVLSAVSSDLSLAYWDYQSRASVSIGAAETLGLFAFGSHDYLATRSPSGDPEASKKLIEQFVSDFHRLDLRYDRALTAGHLRVALTGGYDSQGAEPSYATNWSAAVRVEIDQHVSDVVLVRGGADARLDHYGVRVTERLPREPVVTVSAEPPPTNLAGGAHLDVVWRPTPKVEVVPGARLDLYASTRAEPAPGSDRVRTVLPAVDPRLSARVAVAPRLAWISSMGLAHQYPSLRLGDVPGPVVSVPGFPFGVRRLQSAAQFSQGLELGLPASVTFSVAGFYSHFWGLTDLSSACFQLIPGDRPEPGPGEPIPPLVCPSNEPVTGDSYGLEVMLRRPFTKRLAGWLSYTLSRSTREAHFLTPAGVDELAEVPSDFDRTHVVNAALGYDLGRGWRAGTRVVFYTGTPYSKLYGSVPVPPYNAFRNPAFFRLDVRLEKRWRLGETSFIALVLEGQNVTLSKEVTGLGLECEGNPSSQAETTVCEQSKIGPLTLPSVGVEALF